MKNLETRRAERAERKAENRDRFFENGNMSPRDQERLSPNYDGQSDKQAQKTETNPIDSMNVAELKSFLDQNKVEYASNAKKDELLSAARNVKTEDNPLSGNGGGKSTWNAGGDPNA